MRLRYNSDGCRAVYIACFVLPLHKPLGISSQHKVESSVIVWGVVDDFLCIRNADVDRVHYLSREVTPVKCLQDESASKEKDEKNNIMRGKEGERESRNSYKGFYFYLRFDL